MPTSLLDSSRFLPLANLVAEHGIRYFVETDGSVEGMESARRLDLHAFARVDDPMRAYALSLSHPSFDIDNVPGGDALTFLKTVLPRLHGPAFFWLDPNSPTFTQEEAYIKGFADRREWEWFVDVKPAKESRLETVAWKLEAAKLSLNELVVPDRAEPFDTNWAGPPEMKPRVYRTQSEKDTWYAVAVENEYRLGDLKADDVVVDIGAHIGSFSYLAHLKGSRNILAYEVDPWHFEALEQNLRGLGGIAQCRFAVVRGDEKRLAQYHYDGGWNVFGTTGPAVYTASLDQIIDGTGPIRFLKTDCEGSEWPILYTCTKLDQIQEIAGEYHENVDFHDASLPPTKIAALAGFLYAHGFEGTWTDNVPGIGNFWFKRR